MAGLESAVSKTIAAILSLRDEHTSHNHQPSQEEFQNFAVNVFRRAVIKANGHVGYGPKAVASWASMRAGYRGWMDLFSFWAERAHTAGSIDKEFLSSASFKKVVDTLNLDERNSVGFKRLKEEYLRVNGYPLDLEFQSCSAYLLA
tara:strand:+ start:153 stop:590 length:438 start_codon:yes stop_codon:yes gene_type:complete